MIGRSLLAQGTFLHGERAAGFTSAGGRWTVRRSPEHAVVVAVLEHSTPRPVRLYEEMQMIALKRERHDAKRSALRRLYERPLHFAHHSSAPATGAFRSSVSRGFEL